MAVNSVQTLHLPLARGRSEDRAGFTAEYARAAFKKSVEPVGLTGLSFDLRRRCGDGGRCTGSRVSLTLAGSLRGRSVPSDIKSKLSEPFVALGTNGLPRLLFCL